MRAGQSGAVDVAGDQATAKEQLAVLVDMLRQLGGNASVVAGNIESADPLNAPFTLYVDPYIGSDRFVGGAYNSHEATGTDEEIIAQKLKRIELQRLECGYTASRPFKTINRAAIEAAIITSKDWYTYSDPRAHVDCVTIVLSGGVHIVYNDPGSSSTNLTSWGSTKDPSIAELVAFNPTTGSVLLPRGCSMHGQDLRKTTVRPSWVTAVTDEAADYSNRRSIFKVSGTGFFFNATTMDKIGHTESCHLLDTFHPASKAELDAFYLKVDSAVGSGADLATALLVARPSEYEIVGPIDQAETPSSAWDTTRGASPYIFNWSVRSDYGIGGAFWDGAKIQGLKSMVCANFTGTNQQKDMRAWQVYEDGNWVTLANTAEDYQKYIDATPDNVRRNPLRQTRHISAVNNAYIQKVSIFGIGQSEVTMADNGGEITDNGGNSTFGGCSALAKGYKGFAFDKDKNWAVSRIQAPLNLSEKLSNIRRIELGVIASVTSSVITLSNGLAISTESATVPAVLLAQGYSLANGTRIWVENPNGADWRATLTSSAWASSDPAVINITGALQQSGTNAAAGSDAVGRRVYIRRIVDTRTVAERRASLILNNTASARLPQRNAVLQTDPARSGGAIGRVLAGGGEEVLLVTNAGTGPTPGAGVTKTSELTIRRGAPSKEYAAGAFYRIGTVVRHAGKHWQARVTMTSAGSSPDPAFWGEVFVHMPSAFNPEDSVTQEAPILVLDTDTADTEDSATLGINWTTVWTAAGPVRDQYRSGTDYLGVFAFLRALGFTDAQSHAALVPRVTASRQLDPTSATDFPSAPSGGAATGRGNWAVEFRRPSTIRLYNHQWEWAGFGNYSKAMPAVQQDMSEFNKFTYYFTNSGGGRVVPKGSNEDGFEVTPRGLEDISTGATVSPEGLGGQSLDEIQRTDFPNGIQVGATATVQDLVVQGQAEWSDQSRAKTTREGVLRLATIAQLTTSGSAAPTAGTDTALEAAPDAVTVQGLNRWAIAQRFVSTRTDVLTVFVQSGAADRDLNSMLDNPPTAADRAIPTLARAAEYCNAIIGAGNQLAQIRIAPGLYDPASVWLCNVEFRASDPTQAGWPLIFPSNSAGSTSTDHDYFDGTGYGNLTTRVNFRAFSLLLGNNNLALNVIGRQIRCNRSVEFIGGFHMLGIAELIKLVADGAITQGQLITGSATLPSEAFTTNTATNVETFLNQVRVTNSRAANYDAWTTTSPIRLEGSSTDIAAIQDIVFGAVLPSRKESSGAVRAPYIATNGIVRLRMSNNYLRGNVSITSAGIGVTNALPNANSTHYGDAAVNTPWTWRQFHHTFIGPSSDGVTPIFIDQLGGRAGFLQNPGVGPGIDRIWFQSATKLLPNHIQLLTAAGAIPENDNDGPFLDQFIHAPLALNVRRSFLNINTTSSATLAATEGFVGRFGSNGYNSVKTRGVLLGNAGLFDTERNCRVFLGFDSRSQNTSGALVYSMFKVAGIQVANITQAHPQFAGRAAVTAGSFVVGREYQIVTAGNTDFTLIGATDSNVNTVFTANGAGTGTGTAVPVAFGEPTTFGGAGRKYNPVITTASNNAAGSALALNMALRSYNRGISPEHGFDINPDVVL